MVDQKTQENNAIEGLRHAGSKVKMLGQIKLGILLVFLAFYIHSFAKFFKAHFEISTSEFYEKYIIPIMALEFGLACILAISLIVLFRGIRKCSRPCTPRLFDCVCLALLCFAIFFADLLVLLVSLRTTLFLLFFIYLKLCNTISILSGFGLASQDKGIEIGICAWTSFRRVRKDA